MPAVPFPPPRAVLRARLRHLYQQLPENATYRDEKWRSVVAEIQQLSARLKGLKE